MEGGQRRPKRRLNKAKFRRFAGLVFCVYLAVMMIGVVVNQEKSRAIQAADKTLLEEQLAQVYEKNEELQRKIDFAQTSAFIERMARDIGYVRDGEIKFVTDGESGEAGQEQAVGGDAAQISGAEDAAKEADAPEEEKIPFAEEDGYLPGLPEGLLD